MAVSAKRVKHEDKQLVYEEVIITPEFAKDILTRNYGNRPIRESSVRRYAKLMKEGKWEVTHQAIALDKRGHLVDGQHRLNAVIKAGVPVTMVLSHYSKRKIETVTDITGIDKGDKRTVSDCTGLSQQTISIINCFLRLLYMNNSDTDISVHLGMYSGFEKEKKIIERIADLKIDRTSTKAGSANPLIVMWSAPFKAALFLLVFEKESIKDILDLKNYTPEMQHMYDLYHYVLEAQHRGANTMHVLCTIYYTLKYKQILEEMDMDNFELVRTEMRKIVQKKYGHLL
jgi:hypothetical protein